MITLDELSARRVNRGRVNLTNWPTAWAAEMTAWVAWLAAAHRSPQTVRLRTYHVSRIAAVHPDPYAVTLPDLVGLLAAGGWGPETMRSVRASWAVFYGWAHTTGRTGTNPARLLPTIKAPRGLPHPAPEAVLCAALAAADDRLRLMLLLGAHAGLRRAEIARVHTRDLEADAGGRVLRVQGKGDVVRRVPIGGTLALLLVGAPAGFVFPGNDHGHLSPAYVGKMMSRALGPGWTAHTLRHRFASLAYAADRDLRAVQELLGHAKPETTARYTAVPLDAARRAAAAASL